MNPIVTYNLRHFKRKAANNNMTPQSVLFRRYIKIGFVIAPVVAWFIWAQ
jgi:hypothetical protein